MKYNLLLIVNKAGVAVTMTNVEYNTYEAAEAAIELLRESLASETAYSLRYFVTSKGEADLL